MTSFGDMLGRKTTPLILEAEVVMYLRHQTCGGGVDLHGSPWLAHPQRWPPNIVTSLSRETQAKVTVIREVLAVTIKANDDHDELIQKWDLWTSIRVGSWVTRFVRNCRAMHQQRITGPITSQETSAQIKFWETRTQVRCQGTSKFQEDQERLNLQENTNGLYECRGRIQRDYPIYLPDDALFSKRLVLHAHPPWGSQSNDGETTREMLDTAPQKTNKKSN